MDGLLDNCAFILHFRQRKLKNQLAQIKENIKTDNTDEQENFLWAPSYPADKINRDNEDNLIMTQIFRSTIINDIKLMSEEAHRGCGLVYELYENRFHSSVDDYLNKHAIKDKDFIITVAKKHFDYIPPEERMEQEYEKGTCGCGLDQMTCPNGCFERN